MTPVLGRRANPGLILPIQDVQHSVLFNSLVIRTSEHDAAAIEECVVGPDPAAGLPSPQPLI